LKPQLVSQNEERGPMSQTQGTVACGRSKKPKKSPTFNHSGQNSPGGKGTDGTTDKSRSEFAGGKDGHKKRLIFAGDTKSLGREVPNFCIVTKNGVPRECREGKISAGKTAIKRGL